MIERSHLALQCPLPREGRLGGGFELKVGRRGGGGGGVLTGRSACSVSMLEEAAAATLLSPTPRAEITAARSSLTRLWLSGRVSVHSLSNRN